MNINAAARYLVRIRAIILVVALAAVVELEIYLVVSVAERLGRTTAPQTEGPQFPNVSLGELMAAAR